MGGGTSQTIGTLYLYFFRGRALTVFNVDPLQVNCSFIISGWREDEMDFNNYIISRPTKWASRLVITEFWGPINGLVNG